jgi:excisionase family DNA binding protein
MQARPAPDWLRDLAELLKDVPPLATVAEAQAVLRLSKSSLYALLQDGTLPHVRLGGNGGAIRIPKPSIKAFLRRCARGG